jgi:hypothetical protein
MRSVPILFFGLILAVALGLWSAWLAVRSPAPVDTIRLGAWQAWPNAGTPSADPYSKARLARTGELPLGSGEGLALLAQTDSAGRQLRGRCRYLVVGQTPPARLWTMAVEPVRRRDIESRPGRASAVGSDALLRAPDGSFEIAMSAAAQPGNWLPTPAGAAFQVVVRLYDTTARTTTALTSISMPAIRLEGCG